MSATSATLLVAHSYSQLRVKRDNSNSTLFDNETQLVNSSSSISPEWVSVHPHQLTVTDEVVLALHGIIFLLAVVGNGLVILTLVQNRRMRTVTNIFLLNLAISDLLLAIVCMPFTVIPVMLENFMFGPVMCVMIRYLQGLSVSASAFTLVAISLERFYAICSPLKSRKWQHLRHSYKVLAAVWISAMVLNIPWGLFQKVKTSPTLGTHQCLDTWPDPTAKVTFYVFHLLIADLLVPLTIMTIAYCLIAKTLWKGFQSVTVTNASEGIAVKAKRQMSLTSDASDTSDEGDIVIPANGVCAPVSPSTSVAFSPLTPGDYHKLNHAPQSHLHVKVMRQETKISLRSHSSQSNVSSRKRVVKMLFVIVMEFFVCWTPLYVVYSWMMLDMASLRRSVKDPKLTFSLLRMLAYISSCCNPVTYCFMSKKFRAAFLTAFRCHKKAQKTPLARRPTALSTQVSYCGDGIQSHPYYQGSKSKLLHQLSSNSSNGNGKHYLSTLPESPSPVAL